MADNAFVSPITPQITTGDWTTVNDPFVSTVVNNQARNQLGAKFSVIDSTGRIKSIRYVRYNSTANPAWPGAPAPVYWVDNGHTTVSGVMSESLTANPNSVAGYLVNANFINGNFVFIQTGGILLQASIAGAASQTADALLFGKTGNFQSNSVATGTAVPQTLLAVILANIAGNKADVFVELDPAG